nr:ATP-binding protein [Gracilimonas mengyeensis]
MAYINNLDGMIVVDSIGVVVIFCVAFIPGITVFARKLLFNGVLYLISAMLLLYLGTAGPGLLYLLGITIFTVLSLDKKFGYIAVVFNTLICISVGLLLYMEVGNFAVLGQNELGAWIAISSNLVFLSAMSAILIPILFNGLESAITQENRLRSELEIERGKLQSSIKQLNNKNKELEQFAYTASHDLKEPLRMIRSFMQLLEKRYATQLDDKARQYIHFAVDGAARMTSSIDELLEYSRISRLYNETEEVVMEAIVQDVLKLLDGQISHKNANVVVGTLPTVTGVPVTLKILMQNLVSNALKYQQKDTQPQIDISCKELENHWEFAVKDNGIGIATEHHHEVFGMFKRLHARSEYSGTGMGLAMCKKIIEQHKGQIWIESKEGAGSIFYFTISK